MNVVIPLKRLYDLQEVDWEIQALQGSLAKVAERLADNRAVTSAKKRLEELEATLSKRDPVWKQSEFTVQQIVEKLKNTEDRLYSGAITNPRELSAYEEEQNSLNRQRSAEEEKLLEVMVEVEDLRSERDQARETYTTLDSQRTTEVAELSDEQKRLTSELEDILLEREMISPEIPPQVLGVYDSLIKSRAGHAVAKVERGNCQGCRITLPSGELQQAKISDKLVQCNSCRRILYVV